MTEFLWRWKSTRNLWRITVFFLLLYNIMAVDVKPQKEVYTPDYGVYHNFSTIGATIEKLVTTHPTIFRHYQHYISREGNQQYVIRATNFSQNALKTDKVKLLLSFGEHAREFLPVESLIFLLKVIASPYNERSLFRQVDLNKLDVYIIVLGNPDGRKYVEQKRNYCWRGTSHSVDLNRNFDWEFGGKGSSADTKDEEYRGPLAFSEPETQVYKELTEKIKFDVFVSFHSGIRQIYLPYADTLSEKISREPDNIQEMMKLAQLLSTCTKHTFQYGKAAKLTKYTADGTVFDYMAGVRKIPFSYAIELWGPTNHKGSSCFDLFNPRNAELQGAVEEIIPLYTTLFEYLIQWKAQINKEMVSGVEPYEPDRDHLIVSPDKVQPSLTLGYVLLILLILTIVMVALHNKFRRIYQRRRVISLRSLGSSFSASMFST